MSATPSPSLRLTRRGRLVLLLALVGLLLAVLSVGQRSTQAAPTADGAGAAAPATTTVQPGESLWSLAERIAPQHDPREVIAQIRRLNDLETSSLQVGQHLLLPTAA